MRKLLTTQKVLELYPSLPTSIRTLLSSSSIIEQLSGHINTVLLIDDTYVLRTKKIHQYDFDDIGGCENFKATIDHIDTYNFKEHPNHIILEAVASTDGKTTEHLLYKKNPGVTFDIYRQTHSNTEMVHIVLQIAQLISKLHHIQAPHYGFFKGQQFNTWTDFILYWIDKQSVYIKKNKTLTDAEIAQVKSIFNKYIKVLTLSHPSVIHMDLNSTNFLISPEHKKVECIVDWDNARGGDPVADVSYMLERVSNGEGFSEFAPVLLKEYMRVSETANPDEFMLKYKLYSLFYAFKLLPVHATHASYQNESTLDLSRYVRKMISSFTL